MKTRDTWLIKIFHKKNPETFGLGEVAPIGGLSSEDTSLIEDVLYKLSSNIKGCTPPSSKEDCLALATELCPPGYSSVLFGVEVALLDLFHSGKRKIFENGFILGNSAIPINGLIWMGSAENMKVQVHEKLSKGFKCLKMKVGALDFHKELEVIEYVRSLAPDIVLRLDANGAFANNEVLSKIKSLSEYNIHSIEQPILPRQPEALQLICRKSPIPIALDEELIGVDDYKEKEKLIEFAQPQYLVLKPSLHGGLRSCRQWIDLANRHHIEWWVTSALESNIGLNAICQFTAQFSNLGFQGLGTGQLYHNNIDSPLAIKDGLIYWNRNTSWGRAL